MVLDMKGVDASGKNAVNQEDQRQTAEHKETILKSLLVCKAEVHTQVVGLSSDVSKITFEKITLF